jgi:hypothetical protein
VSFDHDPALAFQCRDLPRKGHWRAITPGSKSDEYFRLLKLKKAQILRIFHDGRQRKVKNDVLRSIGRLPCSPFPAVKKILD